MQESCPVSQQGRDFESLLHLSVGSGSVDPTLADMDLIRCCLIRIGIREIYSVLSSRHLNVSAFQYLLMSFEHFQYFCTSVFEFVAVQFCFLLLFGIICGYFEIMRLESAQRLIVLCSGEPCRVFWRRSLLFFDKL